jgi:putative transposase
MKYLASLSRIVVAKLAENLIMAGTYTSLKVQIVFAVKYRRRDVDESLREELEKYICGIVTNYKSKVLAIYCNPDHIHILIELNPSTALSDLVRGIKSNSSKWMNQKKYLSRPFNWQGGYGAFSYSQKALKNVIPYIENQAEHHRRNNFEAEYLEFLKTEEVEYNKKYVLD